MAWSLKKLKKFMKRNEWIFVPNERSFLYRRLSEFAGRLNYELVLDVGAGMRQYKGLFLDHCYQSCDLETGFHTKQRHDFLASIYNIPKRDKLYDVVLMLQVLEHLEFPVDGLREVNRILKDDGMLFLSVPQAAGDHFEPHHYFNYTQYGLNSVLGQTGFNIETHYRLAGMFYYVGNRIEKMGWLMVHQSRNSNIIFKVIARLFYAFCLPLAWIISRFNFLDKEKRYCIGHIVIARKSKHLTKVKRV
jgi:SAM-dependent methyltransferase